jgi:hypothetical protein
LLEIRDEVFKEYNVMQYAFDYYSSVTSGGDGFVVKLNTYKLFLDECGIPDNDTCTWKDLDTMFLSTNVEEDGDSAEGDANDDRALMRFEWLEIIIRIAFAKYLDTEEDEYNCDDPSDAVQLLCEKNILPKLKPCACHNKDDFRKTRMYNEAVDKEIKPRLKILKVLYEKSIKPKNGTSEQLMSLREWERFMDTYKLFDLGLTKRNSRLCYGWSKMRATDELAKRSIYTSMHFADFLEGLCRVAELKAWPTDEDLANSGCDTMIEFFAAADKDPTLLKLLDDNIPVRDKNNMLGNVNT